MNYKEFIQKYEELLNSGYCECNELNCLDNNPPKKILNIMKEQQQEIERLNNIIKEVREYIETLNEYEILILKIERYLNCYQYFLETQEENNKKIANMIHEFSLGSDEE